MRQYEHDLRAVLAACELSPRRKLGAREIGLDYARAEMLEARGLIGDAFKDTAGNFAFRPNAKGLTYFADKQAARREFWKKHLVKFVSGFISGIITGVLLSWLLGIPRL